jgi:peptidoglycan/LPS O-acetylase OafA/YrhL
MTTTLSLSQKLQIQSGPKSQYYRPELDLLRFAAFFFVFSTHGPRLQDPPGSPLWRHLLATTQQAFAGAGVYGLCLFFFLSSYLITEILLREREQTGSVHLKSFYVRRVLRIWPLYYLGVALAIAIGYGTPQALTGTQITEMIFWLGGWVKL